jgi:DNA-binding Lrp family transcriptional regulator
MTAFEKDILNILTQDARISAAKIAAMLDTDEAQVKLAVRGLEASGVTVKYTAIINDEKVDDSLVSALIEVKVTPKQKEGFDGIAKQIAAFPEVRGVYLMSGAYDLAVFIEDDSLQKVARFVSERISTFEGVLSTATHFILKKYKIEGTLTERTASDPRQQIQA